MGRKLFVIAIIALVMSVSCAQAAGPLQPGKPAGVRRAQSETTSGAIAVGALLVIAAVGYAVSTHPYQIPGQASAATSTQP